MRIGYLVGRYPAASHAFLLREVRALRERGIALETISIRPPLRSELLTDDDREAERTTYYVLPPNPLKLVVAHAWALGRAPLRYLRTLRYALGLGPAGLRSRLWLLFYFAEAIVVARRCAKRGISHLHAHFADTGTESALLATHYLGGHGFTITVHGPMDFAEDGQNRLAEKLRRARGVVAVSEHGARRIRSYLPAEERGKVELIRMGVDAESFSPGPRRDPDAAKLRVLCVGRLVPQKAQATLIDAAASLARRGVAVRVTLAGGGSERRALQSRAEHAGIADRVTITGAVGHDRVVELMRETDVFCLPSLAEGLPAVLCEAMACAVPVVSTPVAGIPELVNDGENGLLVPPGDAEGLASALERLAREPQLRERLGQAGRETVLATHRPDDHAEALALLFVRAQRGRAEARST